MRYGKEYYHNEIELLRIADPAVRAKIEKIFLQNRISYYLRFDQPGLLGRLFGQTGSDTCIICINDWDKEKAMTLLENNQEQIGGNCDFILKKTQSNLP